MVTVELAEEDARLLKRVLETYATELRGEISATSRLEFREKLKEENSVVERVLTQLPSREQ